MLFTEWNLDDAIEVAREEAMETGMERGVAIGEARGMEKGVAIGVEKILEYWKRGYSLEEAERLLSK